MSFYGVLYIIQIHSLNFYNLLLTLYHILSPETGNGKTTAMIGKKESV